MLTGEWEEDALAREADFFAEEVRMMLPAPELSHNPLLSAIQQVCITYDDPPAVTTKVGEPDLSPILPEELWPLMQERAIKCEGMGECFIRLDWDKADGRLTVRVVPSDMIARVKHRDNRPDSPVALEELRPRRNKATNTEEWTWDVWDVSDPKNPIFRIEAVDKLDPKIRRDVTAEYADSPEYPYRKKDTTPIFPWIIYHARVSNCMWNPYRGMEIVRGTLTVAALQTMWVAGFRDGAHPQRYIIDGEVQTTRTMPVSGDAISSARLGIDVVHMNPMSLLSIRSRGTDGRSASASQFQPAMDPKTAGEALEAFEAGLAMYLGISPADVSRGSAHASGYAIVVSRDGLRRAQRRMIPPARMGDRMYLATAAMMTNAYGGTSLPESPADYQIEYAGVGLTLDEVRAEIDEVKLLDEAGLIHPADAYLRFHPGLTRAQAIRDLAEIRAAKSALGAVGAAPVVMTETRATDAPPPEAQT